MADRDFIVSIDKPKPIATINKESADLYQRAIHSVIPMLENFVIEPFERDLKRKTGYNDFNIPDKEVETEITVDRIKFIVITSPTTKRPQYSFVYEKINDYVTHLIEEHQRIGRIKDITSIDGNPYLSVDLLIERIKETIENAKTGKEGINQKITFDLESVSKDVINSNALAINVNRINKMQDDGSARIYLMAKFIHEAYVENIKRFEELIKMRTGYSKENMPEETKDIIFTDIEDYLFLVKVIPTTNLSFSKIINTLVHETPSGKITEKTGLLIKAREGIEDPKIEGRVIKKGDKKFISLSGFQDLLTEVKEENTEKSVRFEISALHNPYFK
jgi:hypothetical protein